MGIQDAYNIKRNQALKGEMHELNLNIYSNNICGIQSVMS